MMDRMTKHIYLKMTGLNRPRIGIVAVLLLAASMSTHAVQLTCAEDKATNAHFCFNEKEVREVGGIRTATLYVGGPKGVDKTAYYIAANCATGVMHLKDKKGVSFAGSGPGEGTAQSRQLRRYVCETVIPTPKKK